MSKIILNSTVEGVFTVDENFCITYLNKATKEIRII
jgi:PAS domain-containing protein